MNPPHPRSTILQAPKERNGAEPTKKDIDSIVINLNHPNAHNRRIAHYYYAKLTGSPVPPSSSDTEELREKRAKLHNSELWIWLRLAVLGATFATVETALILMLIAETKTAVGIGVTGCVVVAIVTGVVGWRMVIEDQEGIRGKERRCQMALAELYAAEERHNLKNQKKREKAQRNLEDGLAWACSNTVKSEDEEGPSSGEPSLGDADEVRDMEFGKVRRGKGVGKDDDPGQDTVLKPASEAQGLHPPLTSNQAKRHSLPKDSSTETATRLPYQREYRPHLIDRASSQISASSSKPYLKDNLSQPSSTHANSSMGRSKPSVSSTYRKLSVAPTPSDVQESLDNACSKDVASPMRQQATRSNSTVSGSERMSYPGHYRTTIARSGSPSNYKDWVADRRSPSSHRQRGSHSRGAKANNSSNMLFGINETPIRDPRTSVPRPPPMSTFAHAVPERGPSLGGSSYRYPQNKIWQSHHSFRGSQGSKGSYSSERSTSGSGRSPSPSFPTRSETMATESDDSDPIQISAASRPLSFSRGQEPPLSRVQPDQGIHDAETVQKHATDPSVATLGESMDSKLSLEASTTAQANDARRCLPSIRFTRRESPNMKRYAPQQYSKQKASDEESAIHTLISAVNGNLALSERESSDDGLFELPLHSAPQDVGQILHAPVESPQESTKVWEGLGIDIVHERDKYEMPWLREWQREQETQQRQGSEPEDPSEVMQFWKTDAEHAQNVFNVPVSSQRGEPQQTTPIIAESMSIPNGKMFTGPDSPAKKKLQNGFVGSL